MFFYYSSRNYSPTDMQMYEFFSLPLHNTRFVMKQSDENSVLTTATKVLQTGGTLLYPTDTLWGIGCDGSNRSAVEQIYRIKQRDHSKAMLVLVSAAMLSNRIPMHVRQLLLAEGRPTTVIIPRHWLQTPVADNLTADDGSIGVRVPQHSFCRQLLEMLGQPIVSTSANLSGRPSPCRYDDIEEPLKMQVDYCVPPLPEWLSHETRGSKIIKVSAQGETFIIRD